MPVKPKGFSANLSHRSHVYDLYSLAEYNLQLKQVLPLISIDLYQGDYIDIYAQLTSVFMVLLEAKINQFLTLMLSELAH